MKKAVEKATHWTVYDRATGRILATGMGLMSQVPLRPQEGILPIPSDPASYCVRGRVLMLRPELNVTVEGRTIRGLPPGSRLVGSGLPMTEADGEWTAPFEAPGSLLVTIDHPHYLPKTVELRDYRADRADAYDAIGNQLDALWKGLRAMAENGLELPAETQAALQKIAAVKAAHPKD